MDLQLGNIIIMEQEHVLVVVVSSVGGISWILFKKHEFIFILIIFYSVQSQQYHLFVCSTDSTCNLESKSRKCCKKCRFEKCLNIGMRPSWVLTPEERCQRMLQRCFCFLFCNSCRSKHSFGVLGWISKLHSKVARSS